MTVHCNQSAAQTLHWPNIASKTVKCSTNLALAKHSQQVTLSEMSAASNTKRTATASWANHQKLMIESSVRTVGATETFPCITNWNDDFKLVIKLLREQYRIDHIARPTNIQTGQQPRPWILLAMSTWPTCTTVARRALCDWQLYWRVHSDWTWADVTRPKEVLTFGSPHSTSLFIGQTSNKLSSSCNSVP